MESYILFFVVAAVTVLSPGPGVVLTISNALRFGASGATAGILGIATATFIVAAVAASSLGILLATSAAAFTALKFLGAAYLVYLGVKLWISPLELPAQSRPSSGRGVFRFIEGFTLQLTNPKAVFFFMAVFPQFVHVSQPYVGQFVLLVATYSSLVVAIHMLYAHSAGIARAWLGTERGGRTASRIGGGTFICFGAGLATMGK